ncbi:MAG: hypothetical protein DPW09_39190 [Anaerolineae bacterium]|nr:hypothetical protein [Anaerolineae bacterium]
MMGNTTVLVDEFETLAERVDQAVNEVRTLDEAGQAKALALKSAVEAFHKVGLTKIIQRLKADPRGKELLFELVDEPSVYALFAMHGLVRADLPTRVSRVIDMVRPYMQSHGGDVELVNVNGETVFVKLHGACNGCSMSAVTLRNGVEESLREHVPEIKHIEVLPNEPGPTIIPLEAIGVQPKEAGWIKGPNLADLSESRPYRLDTPDTSIIIVKLGQQLSAYRNQCAHQALPLDGGILDSEAGTLTCPWHGFCYDARTGECFTAPQAQLEPFPLRVEDGVVWVRPG